MKNSAREFWAAKSPAWKENECTDAHLYSNRPVWFDTENGFHLVEFSALQAAKVQIEKFVVALDEANTKIAELEKDIESRKRSYSKLDDINGELNWEIKRLNEKYDLQLLVKRDEEQKSSILDLQRQLDEANRRIAELEINQGEREG